MLEGQRLLITGVLTEDSLAFGVASTALDLGAKVVLTSFGRRMRITSRAARALPGEVELLELDVTDEDQLTALGEEMKSRWGQIDGLLHSIAGATSDAVGENFLATSATSAASCFEISAFSLKSLVVALLPLMEGEGGGSVVGLDLDASVAYKRYDWMGVAKASLEATARYLALYLGPRGVRVNLVAAGPVLTPSATAFNDFSDQLANLWDERAPLGWDVKDAAPIADATCFLLSPLSRGITGEVLRVDGGFHAVAF